MSYSNKQIVSNGTPDSGSRPRFQPAHRPMNSMDLAKQYEMDMQKIHKYLFKEVDNMGTRLETYIGHVRIIEDSKSPSSRPPPNSPQSNKKDRFLLLSVKFSGRMRLHKAKESSSGVIQIGRSWDFDELTLLELDNEVPTGFICQMGKKYYWEVHTPKERRVWCTTMLDQYLKYTNGKTPKLINCSVEYFHLENLYDSLHGVANSTGVSSSSNNNTTNNFSRTSIKTPNTISSNTFTNAQRSPIKSQSPDLTSLKKNLSNSQSNDSQLNSRKAATAAALLGTATAHNIANSELENKSKLEKERKIWEEQKQQDELLRKQNEEKQRSLAIEKQKQDDLELRRKQEIEKRRQQELERRKHEELERRKQEELERRKQEEIERRQQEEIEMAKQEELKRKQQQEIAAKTKMEEASQFISKKNEGLDSLQQQKPPINNANTLKMYQVKNPGIENIARRGPPSAAISQEHSQLSFEIGDESRFQKINQSFDSTISTGVDNYIDGYISNSDEETQTAPLNLNPPKQRNRAGAAADLDQSLKRGNSNNFSLPVITTTLDGSTSADSIEYPKASDMNVDQELNKLLTPAEKLDSIENKLDTSKITDDRRQSRSRAFSRVSDKKPDNDELLEILEEIGYDPIMDDSASLQKKLLQELDKLQYDKIQTLTQVTSVTSTLKKSISTAFQSCDNIDPLLSLFGVQLSTFKEDVDYIENQGQGLQVEAINEKLLMNELNDIVHSVEISDGKLQKLLGSKITLGYQNFELEKILNELYTALLKISGSDESSEEGSKLSAMKALQEKKHSFETARDQFVSIFKKSAKKLFESVSLSLSSKLEQITPENFDSKFLNTIFLDKMSSLLSLGGMIAFVKCVSMDDYLEMRSFFIQAFKPFFDNLSTVLLKFLNQNTMSVNITPFSFNSDPKNIIDERYMSIRGKKDFGTKRANLFSNEETIESKTKSADENFINSITKYCSQIINVISIEQELIKNLFALSSSSQYNFESIIKIPLEKRCEQFKTSNNFLNVSIEADRDIGDEIFELMKQLFDPTFSSTLKAIFSASKINLLEIPAILYILKTFSQSLAPTSHEYLFSNFTKLEAKINSVWVKEMEQQSQEILTTNVHCCIMNYSKSYAVFFSKIHTIVDSMNLVNVIPFGTDQKMPGNYYVMWNVIKSALTKGIETLKIEVELHDTPNDSADIDANVSIQKHLILWSNYKWIFEESKNLQEFPKDLSKLIDDVREFELRAFTEAFGRQYHIGNIIRLLDDLESLLSNNDNPANFTTYSIENIKAMMSPFKGDSFKQEIANLATQLTSLLRGRCYSVDDKSKENEYSIAIGKQIEKELYNNCMFALCQLYTATFSKLSTIIDTYYNNFEVPVDKYIINFNFKKHYLS